MTEFLPALSVLFAVVATAVPWGLPADATFILPLVVVMMVFCWRAIPGASLPPAAAMGLGLLADIMSGGPLGFWALMCLIASTVGGRARRSAKAVICDPLADLGALAGMLAGFGWLLASLYFFRWIDWWPIAFGALVSIALFPVVLHGLLWIRHGRLRPGGTHLPGRVVRKKRGSTTARRRSRTMRAGSAIASRAARSWSAPGRRDCSGCSVGACTSCRFSTLSEYRLLSDENRMTMQLVAPARGSIYDRFGAVIAEDKENLRVLVMPAFCKNLPGTLNALSKIVPVSAADKDRVMRAARRQSGYYPVLVTEGLTWRQFTLLNVLAPQLPGMRTDRSTYRRYNHGRGMAHVVGYVGMAGKDEVDDDPVMRVPGLPHRKHRFEKTFDRELRGSPGTIKYEVDAHGRVVRELGATPSMRGRDIVLTIDHDLQTVALERIEGLRVASLVVLDVVTGGILAMASIPTFDPNEIAFNVNPRSVAGACREPGPPARQPRHARPVSARLHLQSGHRAGRTRRRRHHAHETMSCPGSYLVGRHRFRCWKAHGGGIDVHDAIKQSCDTYFYETAKRMGIDHLAAVARQLGLGQIHDFGFPGQKRGIIPDKAWKRAELFDALVCRRNHHRRHRPRLCACHSAPARRLTAREATGRAVVPKLLMSAKIRSSPRPCSNSIRCISTSFAPACSAWSMSRRARRSARP